MKITVVNQDEDTARYAFKDVNTTIIESIIDGLNKDSNVAYARYIVDHPDLTDPMLEIKVSSGTPKEALVKAAKLMEQYFSYIEE